MDTQRDIAALVLTFAIAGGLASGVVEYSMGHGNDPVDRVAGMGLVRGDEKEQEAEILREDARGTHRQLLPEIEPTATHQISSPDRSASSPHPETTRGRGAHVHTPEPPLPSVSTDLDEGDGVGSREQPLRAYHNERFNELGLDADYAWEVLRCESGNFDPAVVYGPRTGSLGEIGIGQLKPNGGLLGDFYAQGYGNPWNPYEQIEYISWKVSREGWWAWTCAR